MRQVLIGFSALSLALAISVAAAQPPQTLQVAQGQVAAVSEEQLIGTWGGMTSFQGNYFYLQLEGPVSKNADGSLVLKGKWWMKGPHERMPTPLESATFSGNKLRTRAQSGNGEFTFNGNSFVGHTAGAIVMQMELTRQK